MRICLVHPFPWPEVRRGAERYLDELAAYLAGRHHDVTVLTGSFGPSRSERMSANFVVERRRHGGTRAASRLGCTEVETFGLRAVRPLRSGSWDVVHAFTPSAALASLAAGHRTMYTVLGHPVPSQLPVRRIPRTLFTTAVRHAHMTTTLSATSAAALHATLGVVSTVLPPGVATGKFTPDTRPRRAPARILYSGTLSDDRKRVDLVVAACAILREHDDRVRLLLSGEGDASRLLTPNDGAAATVADGVEVLGPGSPEEVPARYRSATVTVLAAEHEAFGLALVESLASGTPAVCVPGGGMHEIVDADVGCIARDVTPESLAEAIASAITLAADPRTPTRCATRASRWDWSSVVGPAHEDLYARLATSGNGGIGRTRR